MFIKSEDKGDVLMKNNIVYPSDLGTVEYPIVIGGYQLYVHIVPKEISGYDYNKHYVGITQGTMLQRWHGGSGYSG